MKDLMIKTADDLLQKVMPIWEHLVNGGERLLALLTALLYKPDKAGFEALLAAFDEERIQAEIYDGCQLFGYLLEPGFCLLQGQPHKVFPTETALHESWLYALDCDRLTSLHKLYHGLSALEGREAEGLRRWMDFLMTQGLRRVDNEAEAVTVSPVVRRWYTNCMGLKDGDVCMVDVHPWACGKVVAAPGLLCRTHE